MPQSRKLERVLALAFAIVAFLPLLAPLAFGFVSLAGEGLFRLDWLMPAELGLVALVAWLGLSALAFVSGKRRTLVLPSGGLAFALLVASQAVALASGLADGRQAPEGPWFTLVIACFSGYVLGVLALGVSGILLYRDLRKAASLSG